MKVVFVGPTLSGQPLDAPGIVVRPPARHGDVLRAVRDGATAIGIVDGDFEGTAAVWHKEILYALSLGVACLGAASMGALRAAECAAFGMVPVGSIAGRFASGELDDDAAVALISAPAELGYVPLSEPLVDALATLDRLLAQEFISLDDHVALSQSARRLFFKDRTVATIVAGAGLGYRAPAVEALYGRHHFSQKRADAMDLIDSMVVLPSTRGPLPAWSLRPSPFFSPLLQEGGPAIGA